MPIYEYKCSSCGHQQEALQKVSDAPLTRCAKCGEEALSKMVTAAGFQLKGSGWYATDFKGSGATGAKADANAKTDAKANAPEGAKPDAKPDAKTDAKPDAKEKPAAGEKKSEVSKPAASPSGGGTPPAGR